MVQMGGLSIYCLGKHGHKATRCLPHRRTAQNSKCLNDKGGETPKITVLVAAAGAPQRARYPHGPAPCQLPACLPWGAPAHLREEQAVCSWQCFPSSPSSCHPGGISPALLCRDLLFRWKLFKVGLHPAQCLQSSLGYCQALGMSQER